MRRVASKLLVKAAFGELLFSVVCGRGKQGFVVPVGRWLKGELASGFCPGSFSRFSESTTAVQPITARNYGPW